MAEYGKGAAKQGKVLQRSGEAVGSSAKAEHRWAWLWIVLNSRGTAQPGQAGHSKGTAVHSAAAQRKSLAQQRKGTAQDSKTKTSKRRGEQK